jgi:hypothetical protein
MAILIALVRATMFKMSTPDAIDSLFIRTDWAEKNGQRMRGRTCFIA